MLHILARGALRCEQATCAQDGFSLGLSLLADQKDDHAHTHCAERRSRRLPRRPSPLTTVNRQGETSGGHRPDTLEAQMVAAGRGDQAAFAEIYENVAPRIHGLARRILRDPQLAEDVTQEVLLALWQASSGFDPDRGSALSWVMTIAHRRAVDRVRATDAWRRRDAVEAARTHTVPYDETAASAHASLEGQRIRAALATLSPSQRRALELAYFGGLTHSEVSRLMQVPLGTAKSRIRDGLVRLRDVLSSGTAEPA
jgi:RNA polymerase sigma-70 factor (ECF subfamily)